MLRCKVTSQSGLLPTRRNLVMGASMWIVRTVAACCHVWLMTGVLVAQPVIELVTPEARYQGRNVAHNKQFCWLANEDGVLQKINLEQVTTFRKLDHLFAPKSPTAVANELRRELASGMEVQIKGNFVVVAPMGTARIYADAAEQVNQLFSNYFSRRNWKLERLEFPLVMVIHPTRLAFDQDCIAAGMTPIPNLKGFYHPQSNRVTLYDRREETSSKPSSAKFTLNDETHQTLIHETIHQLAFNSGLHARIGVNPRWIVEGLAVTMESGALKSSSQKGANERINYDRLNWFQKYRATRRAGTIADLIANDDALFLSNPLDFYSEAWALTFYLSEARRPEYVRYLKRLSEREPMNENYSSQERLEDFQAVFGKDLNWLETQFLRFIDGL
ncbi:MAG TPA: DUF1570 domain-containing protein [Planctomicrobium sp.]|nr:DUF1570 domain-containing protein [Planctomicrobium sp.]